MTPKQALRSAELHQKRRLAASEVLSPAELDALACREWCREYDQALGRYYYSDGSIVSRDEPRLAMTRFGTPSRISWME